MQRQYVSSDQDGLSENPKGQKKDCCRKKNEVLNESKQCAVVRVCETNKKESLTDGVKESEVEVTIETFRTLLSRLKAIVSTA